MKFLNINATINVKPQFDGEVLKAGTPLDISGAIANSDAAVGLVANDTAKGAESIAIVTEGTIDLTEVAASYGEALTDECIAALKGITFLYGGKAIVPSSGGGGGGSGAFMVTFGGSAGRTPDKTLAEIAAAASAGQLVVFKWSVEGGPFIGIANITLSNGSMTEATASAVNGYYDGMLSTMTYRLIEGGWSSTEIYLGQ